MSIFGSGHEVVTSTTRPATPTIGQMIYETDTGFFQFWNGTVWTALSTKRISVKAYLTASQANSGGDVSWNAVEWDTDPAGVMWSSGSPTRFTVRTSGLYSFMFYGRWNSSSGSTAAVAPYTLVNGNVMVMSNSAVTGGGFGQWVHTGMINLLVNDYVTFRMNLSVVSPTYRGAATDDYERTTAILTRIDG